jgi:hypothetical protein
LSSRITEFLLSGYEFDQLRLAAKIVSQHLAHNVQSLYDAVVGQRVDNGRTLTPAGHHTPVQELFEVPGNG